jgi:hypothetical protein
MMMMMMMLLITCMFLQLVSLHYRIIALCGHLCILRRESLDFTYFVKPYSSVGRLRVFPLYLCTKCKNMHSMNNIRVSDAQQANVG